MAKDRHGTCALCGCEAELTFHHLIPRKLHRKTYFQKRYEKEELKTRGIYVCVPCHRSIHRYASEKTLGLHYNTLEKLRTLDKLQRFVRWRSKRKS